MQTKIVLIRGLPGSGKSTLAKNMKGFIHIEADMFFEVNGKYCFDASKVAAAHDWCVASAKTLLNQGNNVVVSNTFVKLWELQRYVNLGFPYEIVEVNGNWPNIHDVPQDKIEIMRSRWEALTEQLKFRDTLV